MISIQQFYQDSTNPTSKLRRLKFNLCFTIFNVSMKGFANPDSKLRLTHLLFPSQFLLSSMCTQAAELRSVADGLKLSKAPVERKILHAEPSKNLLMQHLGYFTGSCLGRQKSQNPAGSHFKTKRLKRSILCRHVFCRIFCSKQENVAFNQLFTEPFQFDDRIFLVKLPTTIFFRVKLLNKLISKKQVLKCCV